MDRETAKQFAQTPEYRAATWSVIAACLASLPWTLGLPLAGATQQGLFCFAAPLLSVPLMIGSIGLAIYSIKNAAKSIRPKQIRGWAIFGLVIDTLLLVGIGLFIYWLSNEVTFFFIEE